MFRKRKKKREKTEVNPKLCEHLEYLEFTTNLFAIFCVIFHGAIHYKPNAMTPLMILLFLSLLFSGQGWMTDRVRPMRGLHQSQLRATATDQLVLPMTVAEPRTYFIETHGCQMNLADSDIVRAVLHSMNLTMIERLEDADLVLINTCAIREHAEDKVIQRIKYFHSLRKKNRAKFRPALASKPSGKIVKIVKPYIGVLGCMAERLKVQLVEDLNVDFVAGPDAYRKLPDMIPGVARLNSSNGPGSDLFGNQLHQHHQQSDEVLQASLQKEVQAVANAQLDETYADIEPLRIKEDNVHAFVTVQRGCDNHCAFCIVPYTRGRERAVPAGTIINQALQLIREDGVKEIVLLGQNVNSYYDATTPSLFSPADPTADSSTPLLPSRLAAGFIRKSRRLQVPGGVDFAELVQRVASLDPEVRIRFQSPHPQSFPDGLLEVIAETTNVCKALHMPAQHGASSVLQRMDRGYTREVYRALIDRARSLIIHPQSFTPPTTVTSQPSISKLDSLPVDTSPNSLSGQEDNRLALGDNSLLGLSSDFIVGFCGETEDEHQETLALLREIHFDQAFCYAYSPRRQTPAETAGLRRQLDDVPDMVKQRRLQEVLATFHTTAQLRNSLYEVGRLHVVLIEGRGASNNVAADHDLLSIATDGRKRMMSWTGRTDTNKRVVIYTHADQCQRSSASSSRGVGTVITGDDPWQVMMGLDIDEALAFARLSWQLGTSSLSSNSANQNDVMHTAKQSATSLLAQDSQFLMRHLASQRRSVTSQRLLSATEDIRAGDYLVVKIIEARGHTLRAIPLSITSLQEAHRLQLSRLPRQ